MRLAITPSSPGQVPAALAETSGPALALPPDRHTATPETMLTAAARGAHDGTALPAPGRDRRQASGMISVPRRNRRGGSRPAAWSNPNGRARTRAQATQMAQASQDVGSRWWIHTTRAGVTATDRADRVMLTAGDGQDIGAVVAACERARPPHRGTRS